MNKGMSVALLVLGIVLLIWGGSATACGPGVADLGSFTLSTEVVDIGSVAVGLVGGLPAVLSVV